MDKVEYTMEEIEAQEEALKNKKLKKQIMTALYDRMGREANYKDIANDLGIKDKEECITVQNILLALAERGKIEQPTPGLFKYEKKEVNNGDVIIGRFLATSKGFAFVAREDKAPNEEDIFIPQADCGLAIDKDLVEVELTKKGRNGKGAEGKIIRIIERPRKRFVGIIEMHPTGAYLILTVKSLGGRNIFIPLDKLNGAQDGQKAIARITYWTDPEEMPEGEIVDVLGDAGDNHTEMHAILAQFDLPYSYPKEVEELAEKIESGITPEEIAKREDMRGVTTFTIDPVDAKDFDDAISLREVKKGLYEVGVHIADVTHYVTPGTPIDDEGYARATSVYLVDRTIPMLPERLCNFLCSLRPNEEKLAYSVIFNINEEAEILDYHIAKTVICSDRRFTYEEAQARIEGEDGDFRNEILILNDLAQKLRAKRFQAGAIGFERSEVRFKIDENGKPLSIYFKEAKESNMLVEEFMLLANKTVAAHIGLDKINQTGRKRTPKTFVYRIHDKPNDEKYNRFAKFVKRFGYEAMPKKGEEINNAVNRILHEVKGKGEQDMVETLAIRTMAKAVYTTKNIGHYGLAFDYYTHFTSPIRRYPDMVVHRLLDSYLHGGRSANGDKYEEMCKHCSEQEVMAADAERESIKYKQVEFMLDRVGEDFVGTITGVTDWGIYVEIDETKCEGMVSIHDMDEDNYYFDEDNYCIIGKNTKKKYQIGQKVTIRIANANLERKQLDFVLAGSPLKDIEVQNKKAKEAGLPLPCNQRHLVYTDKEAEARGERRKHGKSALAIERRKKSKKKGAKGGKSAKKKRAGSRKGKKK
ncbi:MAG: ribonuclease R [Bacteroidia bacterium]|nr:ribonuclease R [Bacteroidia bacterium]